MAQGRTIAVPPARPRPRGHVLVPARAPRPRSRTGREAPGGVKSSVFARGAVAKLPKGAWHCGTPQFTSAPDRLARRPRAERPRRPMFDNLSQRLGRVVKQLRGEARLTEANIQDALREVRLALL